MTRFARQRRVFFVEEPRWAGDAPTLRSRDAGGVVVLTPELPESVRAAGHERVLATLLRTWLRAHAVALPVIWFYTPMMLPLVDELESCAVVFDCMDELSAFASAPAELVSRERALLSRADLVFTGGYSLYELKKTRHPRVFPFPSSVDVAHFAKARMNEPDPADQAALPKPRIGFCGVIDERFDGPLVAEIARLRPGWQLVLIGPTAKVRDTDLPKAHNIHYLGMKAYADLPGYLGKWQVAMMPFARNDATRYISPTKTPEFLAAGLPVVATSIRDVVRPYGEHGLVRIADTPLAFVEAVEAALQDGRPPRAADAFVGGLSWDRTWADMNRLLEAQIRARSAAAVAAPSDTTARQVMVLRD